MQSVAGGRLQSRDCRFTELSLVRHGLPSWSTISSLHSPCSLSLFHLSLGDAIRAAELLCPAVWSPWISSSDMSRSRSRTVSFESFCDLFSEDSISSPSTAQKPKRKTFAFVTVPRVECAEKFLAAFGGKAPREMLLYLGMHRMYCNKSTNEADQRQVDTLRHAEKTIQKKQQNPDPKTQAKKEPRQSGLDFTALTTGIWTHPRQRPRHE